MFTIGCVLQVAHSSLPKIDLAKRQAEVRDPQR